MSSEQPRPLRILVTDDERSLLEAYRLILHSAQAPGAARVPPPLDGGSDDVLTMMGWRFRLTLCEYAENAVAAAHHAVTRGDPYAMAFFDVRMPPGELGGLWAAEQVRALDPHVAIVIVTGGSDVDSRELVQLIPPPDRLFYIHKPFHPREVIHFVLALGARWEAERKLQRINEDLESRVEERTRDLANANAQLRDEISERQRAEERILASLREKEILLKEIHHRVKNNLQVTSSMLRLQSRYGQANADYAAVLRESENRIRSMALIHEVLYDSDNLSGIDVRDYLIRLTTQLARSYGISASQGRGAGHVVEVDAESLLLGLDVAVPCGLIINELVTNAYKYAFADGRQGMIRVSLHTLDIGGDGTRQIRLIVSDDGPGLPAGIDLKSGASLGLRLVRMLSEDQLGGQVEVLRAAETTSGTGTEFRITFAAPAP